MSDDVLKNNFIELRKKIIRRDFNKINSEQMKAVTHVSGPVLVLAGAGSGKTTTIVSRIVNMIKYGNAYESEFVPENLTEGYYGNLKKDFENDSLTEENKRSLAVKKIEPKNILAVTFTNKAANELKTRLLKFLGEDDGTKVLATTFHSFCVKILREFAPAIGYSREFSIYDSDDSQHLIKICLKELNIDDKVFPYKFVLEKIAKAKDSMMSTEKYAFAARNDSRDIVVSKAYKMYQSELVRLGVMDFDDLIFNTVLLVKEHPDIFEILKSRYTHILVDEYQDTSKSQNMLINKFFKKGLNVCVVGDDDQSIYSFRGADIKNIMNFDSNFSGTRVVRLEQNYRSTKNILDAANGVIGNNFSRKSKKLWTKNTPGEKITLQTSFDENCEAKFVASRILEITRDKKNFDDIAVLYRMNFQSSVIERAFVRFNIPYRVVGGTKFYDRREVKDIIAYLSVINNPQDEVRLRRIINTPKRLIGEKTINKSTSIASKTGKGFLEIFENATDYKEFTKYSARLIKFSNLIKNISKEYKEENLSIFELYNLILKKTKLLDYYLKEKDGGAVRAENLKEFGTTIKRYEEEEENVTLSGFLEQISLVSDSEDYNESSKCVSLMTVHASKGLEFPVVFLVGMEEGIFPKIQTLGTISSSVNIEEERRLAYVAITRAKEKLYITNTNTRMIFGNISRNKPSKFLEEIPENIIEIHQATQFLDKNEKRSKIFELNKEGKEFLYDSAKVFLKDSVGKEEKIKTGDKIFHKIFGKGIVLFHEEIANDVLLEIDFEEYGTKKLMSRFSSVKKA